MNRDDGTAAEPPTREEADTGLPLLRTWRSVYVCVVVSFCVWVAGLLLLQSLFP